VELDPNYIRALLRRAELYEKTEKLDEALEDYKTVVEKDPSVHQAREACMVSLFSILCPNFKPQSLPSYSKYSVLFMQAASYAVVIPFLPSLKAQWFSHLVLRKEDCINCRNFYDKSQVRKA